MIRLKTNHTLLSKAEIEAGLNQVFSDGLTEVGYLASQALMMKLDSASGPRTGFHLDYLPRVSSAKESMEYPQEQSGNLISSVANIKETDTRTNVGFFYDESMKITYNKEGELVPLSDSDFNETITFLEFSHKRENGGPLYQIFEGDDSYLWKDDSELQFVVAGKKVSFL